MSDDLRNTGSPDRDRINIHEEHEVRYWSEALDITPDQLKSVVASVGTSVEAVRRHVGR